MASARILLVDDNEAVRRGIRSLLTCPELSICGEAADGIDAVQKARELRPDAILMDITMPRMDGLRATRLIRADLPETKVIIVSHNDPAAVRRQAAEVGAHGVVEKANLPRELLQVIERILERPKNSVPAARPDQHRVSEEYRTLLNNAPLGIFVIDSDWRIRQVNPVAKPLFGNVPNLIGRDFDQLVHMLWAKDYADEIVGIFRHTLETGESYSAPERAERRADRGVSGYYEWQVDRLSLAEGSNGAVCYFRDISGQVRARLDAAESESQYRRLAETLEEQVRDRTRELEQQSADIIKQSEQLRDLSGRLLLSQDEERRHIARELHDSAGQTLTALALKEAAIARRMKAGDPGALDEMEELQKLTQELSQEIRTMSYLLHPPLLDESGIDGALEWYIEGFTGRSGIEIELEIDSNLGRFAPDIELAVFRIVQEALTNIHRHSGAKKGVIRIARSENEVALDIQDYGKGMSAERLRELHAGGSGVGFRGMRERVHQLRGHLTFASDPTGTAISVIFPIRDLEPPPSSSANGNGFHCLPPESN